MKIKNKNLIILSLVILISICNVKVSNAGFIDEIKSLFGVAKETKSNVTEETKIQPDIEEYLDSRQKEVVAEIDNIYQNIQNIDLKELENKIDYDIPNQVIYNVNEFFNEYKDSFSNSKSILSTIKYSIESVSNAGEKVVVKIKYTLPSISKLFTKVLPEIIIKNAKALFDNQLTNENLDSILESVSKEIEKGVYEVETYTRDFSFKNVGGKWKLIDINDIIQDATQYVKELTKLF